VEVSRVLLDTSAYSMLTRGHQGIRDTLETAETIYLSPVVLGELHAGFGAGTRKRSNEAALRRFLNLAGVEIATMGEDTALCYAQIVLHLRAAGRPIPTNDIWIAAAAMERSAQLITTDTHFHLIPQIRLDFHEH
jgi:tRNA(fMet)-specific endonuclease VapC